MSGLFNTFNIVKRGMSVQQTALQITSHNIANANTEGYSVQRAELKTTQPFGMPSLTTSAEPGQLGTGVEVAAITRARDKFIDSQIRKESSTLGRYEAREEFLSEIEVIFLEPSDTGISSVMSQYWDSWQGLSTNPESETARTLVAQKADEFATALNHTYTQLEDLKANSDIIIEEQVFEVNSILTQIQDLNTQIKAVSISGKIPNDLMDRRDLLIDQLSERMGITVEEGNFNGISIKANTSNSSDNIYLLDGNNNTQNITYDPVSGDIKLQSNGQTLNINNGSIYGYQTIKAEINEYQNQLDTLAAAMISSVNAIHTQGGGKVFFEGTTAKDIKVNQEILNDSKNINAGKTIPGEDGDGSRALFISQLRTVRMDMDTVASGDVSSIWPDSSKFEFSNNPAGKTMDGYYKSTITQLGTSNQEAKRMVTNQEALLSQLETRRESISGVSLDEEMANMIQFQRSFEANAKMITTIDQLLDVVVNGLIRR